MSRFDCDSDFEEEMFACADSGASQTFPKPAGDLKRGDLLAIRGRPCKVLDVSKAQPGKHGATKVSIEAEDIFTGKKSEVVAPSSYPMPCPVLVKAEFLLMDLDEETGALSLLDDENVERNDVDLPFKDNESLARAIRAHFHNGKTVTVVTHRAMGVEAVVAFKVESSCGK